MANTDAYIQLLKSDTAYKNMNTYQQETYLAIANEFITSGGAYEVARNNLLVELSDVILQIRMTDDEKRLEGLRVQYDDLIDELEEYGVGPENKTDANPSYYFDKAEQAQKRLEANNTLTQIHTGDVDLRNRAGILYPCFPIGFNSALKCPARGDSYGPGTSHAESWVLMNGRLIFQSSICLADSVSHRSVNFQFRAEEDVYHIWGDNRHYYDNTETQITRTNGNADTCQLIVNSVRSTALDRAELDSTLYSGITVSGTHT